MKITHISYYTILAIVYCLVSFVLEYFFIGINTKFCTIGIALTMIEMALIYYVIGIKNLFKIKESNIIFYICLHLAVSIFITVNVLWFVESIFGSIISHYDDIYIFYALLSGINFMAINAAGNYSLNVYENNKTESGNSTINQSLQLKKEAELFKLRQQVDPHFLFNSLNSIHALTHIDHEKANKMIYSLSQYFRNSIQKQDQNFITLRDEIYDIRLYLSIEMVRFGHRLKVHENIEEGILNTDIPPLILQPLIENAIKYGIYGTSGNVDIHIQIRTSGHTNEQQYAECVISNPFDPNTHINSGTGFGIAGIMRRLYLTYSRNDLIKTEKFKENNTPVFRVTLRIPVKIAS